MIKRFFKWFWGETEPRDIHVHVHIHMSTGGVETTPQITNISSRHPEVKRHLPQSEKKATGAEIAEVILAGGIQKAVDKCGEAAITQGETVGVDDQLAAVRRLRG